MQHLKYFGHQLYRLRKRAGMTQVQLAHRLGVNQSYIAKLEGTKEEKQPTIDFLLSVSELFNVGLDDLLGTQKAGELPPDDFELLPEEIRQPIQQLVKILIAGSANSGQKSDWQIRVDSIRAFGGEFPANSEVKTGVKLLPKLISEQVNVETLQQELF